MTAGSHSLAKRPLSKRLGRALAIVAILCPALLVVSFAGKPAAKDYIAYWSAGQLLARHGDPYAAAQVLAVERSVGYMPAKPIVMRNPPWALFLPALLSGAGPRSGLFWWTAGGLACLLASLQLLRIAPQERVLAYFFAPVFACFSLGQSSPLLLLGFALFLRFHRSRPLAAGAALLLMAIKPHLFLVFWPVLLIDCLYRKNLRLLAGLAAAVGAATLLAAYVDPQGWPQYFAMLRAQRIDQEFLPVPAMLFRYLIAHQITWLQFAPVSAAVVWGIWFYRRNRFDWSWRGHGMLLMLVTIFVSPYAWTTDEIVLLPAMMVALASPAKPKYAVALFALLNGVEIVMLAAQIQANTVPYLWTSSAWLAWYLYCTGGRAVPEVAADGLEGAVTAEQTV